MGYLWSYIIIIYRSICIISLSITFVHIWQVVIIYCVCMKTMYTLGKLHHPLHVTFNRQSWYIKWKVQMHDHNIIITRILLSLNCAQYKKSEYRIVQNFRGRKLSQILRFESYLWKFSPWNLGMPYPPVLGFSIPWKLFPAKWLFSPIRESFLPWKFPAIRHNIIDLTNKLHTK